MHTRAAIVTLLPGAAMALALLGCGQGEEAASEATEGGFPRAVGWADGFEVISKVALEEHDTVLNVDPKITVAPSGELVVADSRDAHVRLYDREGRLLKQIG